MGYKITSLGSQLLPIRVAYLKNSPPPKTISQLRRFLGMLNFSGVSFPTQLAFKPVFTTSFPAPNLRVPTSPAANKPSSTPFILGHIRPHGPPGLDPRVPTAGRHTTRLGTTTEMPVEICRPHRQNTSDCLARPDITVSADRVQACIHIGRDSVRHRQPTSPARQCTNKSSHTTTTYSADYTLRSNCAFPGSLHYLNPLLRRVDVGTPTSQQPLYHTAYILPLSAQSASFTESSKGLHQSKRQKSVTHPGKRPF